MHMMTRPTAWWFKALLGTALGLAVWVPAAPEPAPTYRGHGLAMHGDLKYPADFAHFDYARPDAPKGGALRLGAIGGYDSFNGFILRGSPAEGLELLYDTLLVESADEPFSCYGRLVETMEVPADRSSVTFDLRPGARWHDGKPITADDVVFTFNSLMEKGHPSFKFYYKSVQAVEKLGERRVRFAFSQDETNREMPLIIGQIAVLPKHYWEGRDLAATTLDPPLGSGPYRLKAFEANRYVTYERVPDYWAADIPVCRGLYNAGEITYEYYRDQVVLLEAFKAGKLDIHVESMAKNWATAYDLPAVTQGLMLKEEIPHQRTAGMQAYVFNLRRPIFQDPRVRQAVACAFDFTLSNRKFFYDSYTRCRSYFGNSELEAKGLPEGEELEVLRQLDKESPGQVPPEVFTAEYNAPSTGPWTDEKEHSRAMRQNLRQAKDLLQAAGWTVRAEDRALVNQAVRDARNEPMPFAFEVLLVSPAFERITLPFTQELEKLGIKATVRTVDTAQYQNRVDSYDFDMVVQSWGQSQSPGNEQRDMWTTQAAGTNGSQNLAGIRSPAVDKAVDLVIQAADRKSLVQRTRALDRLLQWGHYVVPQWYYGRDRVASWDKFGRPAVVPLRGGVNLMAWWLDPAKTASFDERLEALK
jgi:microcin C transport system substrate-binding protein